MTQVYHNKHNITVLIHQTYSPVWELGQQTVAQQHHVVEVLVVAGREELLREEDLLVDGAPEDALLVVFDLAVADELQQEAGGDEALADGDGLGALLRGAEDDLREQGRDDGGVRLQGNGDEELDVGGADAGGPGLGGHAPGEGVDDALGDLAGELGGAPEGHHLDGVHEGLLVDLGLEDVDEALASGVRHGLGSGPGDGVAAEVARALEHGYFVRGDGEFTLGAVEHGEGGRDEVGDGAGVGALHGESLASVGCLVSNGVLLRVQIGEQALAQVFAVLAEVQVEPREDPADGLDDDFWISEHGLLHGWEEEVLELVVGHAAKEPGRVVHDVEVGLLLAADADLDEGVQGFGLEGHFRVIKGGRYGNLIFQLFTFIFSMRSSCLVSARCFASRLSRTMTPFSASEEPRVSMNLSSTLLPMACHWCLRRVYTFLEKIGLCDAKDDAVSVAWDFINCDNSSCLSWIFSFW